MLGFASVYTPVLRRELQARAGHHELLRLPGAELTRVGRVRPGSIQDDLFRIDGTDPKGSALESVDDEQPD